MPLPSQTAALRYQIYGLTLCSDTPLPELQATPEASERAPDILVRFAGRCEARTAAFHWFMLWSLPSGEVWLSCAKVANGYLLHFPGLADFSVNATGRDITVMADSDAPSETLRHLLLDQVLPLVLNLQGREALHATAVLTPLGVCAFMGPAGTGKSTLAASFRLSGYPVLSDDCLVLQEDGGRILATPAYPGLRLWEDSLEALGAPPGSSRPVAEYTSKQRLLLTRPSQDVPLAPQPLSRIYALVRPAEGEVADGPTNLLVQRLSGREAMMALISSAFRLDITDRARLVRQFLFLERVVRQVPLRRLQVPNRFSALPDVREGILADLAGG